MKKLLFITPFVPSSRTAGQHYTLRLLDRLSRDYSIDICLFHYPDETVPPSFGNARVVKSFTTSTVRMIGSALKIPLVHPIFSSRFRLDLIRFLLNNQTRYDFFYFDFCQTFIYSLLLRKPAYLMAHDVVTQLFGRKRGLLNRLSAAFCRVSESIILKYSKATILCFSVKDQKLITKYSGRHAIVVDFLIDERAGKLDYRKISLKQQLSFYGAWHRKENSQGLEWFIDNILPKLDDKLEVVVMGKGLPGPIKRKIDTCKNIKYLGFVENPYEVIAQCQALVAPLFEGAGVKVKVVEALACGTPVIGSAIAFEGIDFAHDLPIFQVDSIATYLEAIDHVNSYTVYDKARFKARFESVYPRTTFDQVLSSIGLAANHEVKAMRRAPIP